MTHGRRPPVGPERERRDARRWLVALLSADGAGVLVLSVAAALSMRPSMISLAVVAAAGWVLALAGIPTAVQRPTPAAVKQAGMRVAAGISLNTIGAVWIAVSYPSTMWRAAALLVAGAAIGLAYLLLLRRLHPAANTA
jgi:hypothetical protein